MASKAVREWDDLPPELVEDIARRLPCLADRVRMAAMYRARAWREVVLHQLPWLLLPYRRACENRRRQSNRWARFFCFLCNKTARYIRVPWNTGGARFFGAYQGGWVFLAYDQNRRHALINLRTHGEPTFLPDAIPLGRPDGPPTHQAPIAILAATLSAPPPSKRCVAAAIVTMIPPIDGPNIITLWRMGSRLPSCSMQPSLLAEDIEDVIYHNGAFHFLTQGASLPSEM